MSLVQDPSTSTAANVKAANTAPVATDAALVVTVSPNSSAQTISGPVTANQGTAAALAAAWPVKVTDGTNVLGTPTNPVKVDPTGTTAQPVSGTVAVSSLPTIPTGGNVIGKVEVTDGTNVIGTPTNPVKTDPTGTTAQPVTGTVAVSSLPTIPTGGNVIGKVEITDGTNIIGTPANPVRCDPTGTTKQPVLLYDASGNAIGSLVDGSGVNGLMVGLGGTNFPLSTANSTTTQLGAGATFTGVIETVYNEQAISLLLVTDQPGALTINQYIDSLGHQIAASSTYYVDAGIGFSRTIVANGNFFNLTFKNTGSIPTTTLNINTAFGILPCQRTVAPVDGPADQRLTVTLAGLATGAAQNSVQVDDLVSQYEDVKIMCSIKTGASGVSSTGYINIYGYASDGVTYPEGINGAASGTVTLSSPTNLILIAQINANTNGAVKAAGPFSFCRQYGIDRLPRYWGVVVQNMTGAALDATAANSYVSYQGSNDNLI